MKKLLICLAVLFSTFLFTNSVSAYTLEKSYEWLVPLDYGCNHTIFEFPDTSYQYIIVIGVKGASRAVIQQHSFSAIPYFEYNEEQGYYDLKTNSSGSKWYTHAWRSTDDSWYYGADSVNSKANYSMYQFDPNVQEIIATNFDIVDKNGNKVDLPFYNSEPTTYNINLHLNGGSSWDTNEKCNDIGCYIVGNQYEDYTITVPGDNLISYLSNVYITKEPMQFVGWYYDEKLTQKVNSTDTIDSDKHFYAKYQYKNVEDFLNNTTFNSYTFDENYQYAIISLNNQENRDIYLGLNIMSYNLEVYKYNKVDLSYDQGSSICLTSIFSKDNKYYYQVSDSLDNNYEVLIIPKEKLNGNYEFLLSSNAYVTYTNDLKNVVIKDETGSDITTDIENSYNYSQDNLLNSENDLLEIFKDLINNKDNNVFSYFNQVWNYMKRNKLFTYFMTLIIGSLIILIIKAASR